MLKTREMSLKKSPKKKGVYSKKKQKSDCTKNMRKKVSVLKQSAQKGKSLNKATEKAAQQS